MIKKLVKSVFGTMGYELKKKPTSTHKKQSVFTMKNGLKRIVERGVEINTIIDVGASDGRWTDDCLQFYPNAQYLLVEAQQGHFDALTEFKSKYDQVDFIIAAAGSRPGEIFFDDTDLFGGLASETPVGNGTVKVPMIRLDDEIERRGLNGPFMLKLDTHGFEVPILEGAERLLKQANLVVIETYNFRLTDDSLRFYEMCAYMERLGFMPVDMVDFMHRKKDQAFWQMDTFFIPKTDKVFQSNTFN